MNQNNPTKIETLIEKLAEIEHEQWISWARSILQGENVSEERKERWEGFMVPYGELPENWKESDRKWAREVIGVIMPLIDKKLNKIKVKEACIIHQKTTKKAYPLCESCDKRYTRNKTIDDCIQAIRRVMEGK